MNIIEAEDMVKGLPDQALFQEAQFPSGRIPQYLAVSEVQRRQDMRQRFQAAQQEQQSSVKDQILQGGIGSTGMAPEMSSMPPMAPQMPPQGGPMPPQMPPQMPPPMGMAGGGITPGGIVYMQVGRTVPDANNELTRLISLRRAAMAKGDPASLAVAAEIQRRIDVLNPALTQSVPNPALPVNAPVDVPVSPVATNPQDLETRLKDLIARGARPEQIDALKRQIAGSLVAPVAAPPNEAVDQVNPAVNPTMDPSRRQVRPDTTSVTPQNQRQTGPSINLDGKGIASLLQQYMAPTEISPAEKAYSELIAAQTKQGLPAALDYSSLIKQSEDSQKEARDAARSQGISAALMQLGAGLAAGDISGGQQRAAEAVSEIMSRGRQEASAERQYGRQLQMQSVESQRQNQIAQMNFVRENAKDLANLSSTSRKEAQEKFGTALNVATSFTNAALNRASEAKIAGERINADNAQQKEISRRAYLEFVRENFKSIAPKRPEGPGADKKIADYNRELKKAIILAYRMAPPERFFMTQTEVDEIIKRSIGEVDASGTLTAPTTNQGSGQRPPISGFNRS